MMEEKKEAIGLKYSSTRGNGISLDSAEAIIAGLADDGGLFVPAELPKVDEAFIEASRLPPDMQQDVGTVVRLYRKQFKKEE